MKILVISNLYPPHSIGGYEMRCKYISDKLQTKGHNIRILTSMYGVQEEQINGNVHRRLKIHGYFGRPWLPIYKLFFLEKHNKIVINEELEDFKPDIIHIWNLGGLSKGLILSLQITELPIVYDVSDHWIAQSFEADVWFKWWNNETGSSLAKCLRHSLRLIRLNKIIQKNAPFGPWGQIKFTNIYFCSESLKQITINQGYELSHANVIYCGIDTGKFRKRSNRERFQRLLFVGRLHEDKDPITAILSLKYLPDYFKLSIFGSGEEEYVQYLKSEALNFGKRIKFTNASSEEMRDVYAQHDLFLFTSKWEEPFALTPLEAMAAQLPVISTLEGGSKELIRDGENALSFQTSDPEDLAKKILLLENQSHLRTKIVETAYKEVIAKYNLDYITDKIEDYLKKSCLESKKS